MKPKILDKNQALSKTSSRLLKYTEMDALLNWSNSQMFHPLVSDDAPVLGNFTYER